MPPAGAVPTPMLPLGRPVSLSAIASWIWNLINSTSGPITETIRGCEAIIGGDCDDIPEQAFLMCGTIDDVYEKNR